MLGTNRKDDIQATSTLMYMGDAAIPALLDCALSDDTVESESGVLDMQAMGAKSLLKLAPHPELAKAACLDVIDKEPSSLRVRNAVRLYATLAGLSVTMNSDEAFHDLPPAVQRVLIDCRDSRAMSEWILKACTRKP